LKRLAPLFATFLLVAGCANSSPHFQTMDLDRDGVLSPGEFSDAVADASFAKYDRNGDHVIDRNEWLSAEHGPGAEALFRARDLSGNGRISPQEARLAAEKNQTLNNLFTSVDTNRDGVLDRDEARAYQRTAKKAAR
jgi:Ca2+-binding EF-hand superfamily protein